MKQIISSIKESVFLRIYLILFSLINFTYVFFEVLKSRYAQKSSLASTIEGYQFEYLSSISNIVNFLEVLIISMFLIYLIVAFMKKDKLQIRHFITINFSFFISLLFINYIVSFIFSAPSGNSTQQLIIPFLINFLVMIYFVVITLYKKVIKIQSN